MQYRQNKIFLNLRRWQMLAPVCVAVWLAGCVTDSEEARQAFEQRAAKYPGVMAVADGARLQRGEVRPGDTREMVWIARGDSTRRTNRVSAGQTNEVWVYSRNMHVLQPAMGNTAWQPAMLSGGRVLWTHDPSGYVDVVREVDVLRVEFANNRVVAVEAPKDLNPTQP